MQINFQVHGPKSFEDLRSVDGPDGERIVCKSFHEACVHLGLTHNDKEAEQILDEAFCHTRHKNSTLFHPFFVSVIVNDIGADPLFLFNKFKTELCADKMHQSGIDAEPTEEMVSEVLVELSEIFEKLGYSLDMFNLPIPTPGIKKDTLPKELQCELDYDQGLEAEAATKNEDLLNDGQKIFIDTIWTAFKNQSGGIYSLEAAGGTGKSFCIGTLLAKIRGEGKIVVCMATSGIAATLFKGGRTVHHKLKVPITLCNDKKNKLSIKENSAIADLIKRTELFIIDEYTMGNRLMYEAIDRSLRDLLKIDQPFGGKMFLFSGDWQQCLPVVQKGSRADIVQQTFKASVLWKHVKQYELTENMRVKNCSKDDKDYAEYLIKIGRGQERVYPEIGEFMIKVPDVMMSKQDELSKFCDEIFPDLGNKINQSLTEILEDPNCFDWLHARTIICPTNDEVEQVNRLLMERVKGSSTIYRSADSVIDKSQAIHFPIEFINQQTPSGVPSHILILKPGTPIMLMRNMDPTNGHVNGARYHN